MRYLFIIGMGLILSACSECKYGLPYVSECAPKRITGTLWSDEQEIVIGSNISHSKARTELLDCALLAEKNIPDIAWKRSYKMYCMMKKGYLSISNIEACQSESVAKENCLQYRINKYEKALIKNDIPILN